MNVPLKDAAGQVLDAAGVMARARMIEEAGFDGIWMGDGISPGMTRPDALMWLLVAAVGTQRVEVGTCILQVPLRNPVELSQRLLTLQALTNGRFSLGVGAGSTKNNHDSIGVDFDQRFRLLRQNLIDIRRLCNGETVGVANLNPWPRAKGGPPIIIGAWGSGIWVKRAAEEYDGWMSSAGRTNFKTLADGIQRYRDFGGRRALISTCLVDLSAPSSVLADDQPFNLRCGPAEAADRLGRAADLGYDDILLVKANAAHPAPLYEPDFSAEELAAIRALLPRDTRPRPERAATLA